MFTAANGRRLSHRHVQRRFAAALKKAGIARRLTPHSCRHRFAMRLYERTGDIALVQAGLQHRSIASTMVYARVGDERLRAAMG